MKNTVKTCRSCKKTKNISQFRCQKLVNKIYYYPKCKKCISKEKYVKYVKLTKEEIIEKQRKNFELLSRRTTILNQKGSENLNKVVLGSSKFEFKDNEKFKPINRKTFISSKGRVLSLNVNGYFNERIPFITKSGSLQVSYIQDNGKPKTEIVSYMVLKAFVGGYYKQRRVNYINGDKTDCSLVNLEWLDGFQNGIDTKYLLSLKDKNLEIGDLYIKYYLLYQNEWLLMRYIMTSKMYFKKILNDDFKNIVDDDTLFEEIYNRAKKDIDEGKYIPLSIYSRKYKKREDNRLIYFLRVKCLDFLYSYQKVTDYMVDRYSKEEYIEIDDYDLFFNEL